MSVAEARPLRSFAPGPRYCIVGGDAGIETPDGFVAGLPRPFKIACHSSIEIGGKGGSRIHPGSGGTLTWSGRIRRSRMGED